MLIPHVSRKHFQRLLHGGIIRWIRPTPRIIQTRNGPVKEQPYKQLSKVLVRHQDVVEYAESWRARKSGGKSKELLKDTDFLLVSEVSKMFGVDRRGIHYLIKTRKVRYTSHKEGKGLRYRVYLYDVYGALGTQSEDLEIARNAAKQEKMKKSGKFSNLSGSDW